jgi:hypothetical protein
MRFLSFVKSAENQGPAPQVLQDAMAKPSWEGECEVRPITFFAP